MSRWTELGQFVADGEVVGRVTRAARYGEMGVLAFVAGAEPRWSAAWSEQDARGWVERTYYAGRTR
jgi:hypothetical protein